MRADIKNLWPLIHQAAKESGRDADQIVKNVELFISYSQDYQEALASARKWKPVLIPNILNLPIDDPRELERQGNAIPDTELEKTWTITTDSDAVIKKTEDAISLWYNEIQLHSASPSEESFLNMCNKQVLPYLKEKIQHS